MLTKSSRKSIATSDIKRQSSALKLLHLNGSFTDEDELCLDIDRNLGDGKGDFLNLRFPIDVELKPETSARSILKYLTIFELVSKLDAENVFDRLKSEISNLILNPADSALA